MHIELSENYRTKIGNDTDDRLLGYVGEVEARTITFSGLECEGAELYILQLNYPDGASYGVDITSGEYTVEGSLLYTPCQVECQIYACKSEGDTYKYVKKSNKFSLYVRPSLDGEPATVPTYEQSVSILEKAMGIMNGSFGETGGSGTTVAPEQHNGIFRGKDLTDVYTVDEIYSRVADGTFDDLFLGDYFTVSITTTLPDSTVKTEDVSLMIAGFNYYYNCGDTELTKPHVVLIPRKSGLETVAKMNTSNTTSGGYIGSYMHTTVLPCYAESFQKALGNHVLTYRDWLTNKVTSGSSMAGAGFSGAASGAAWADVTLQLMNEVQLYGTTAFSSSAYDVGVANRQLPVFKFITPVQYSRATFWLRSVVSSSDFARCATAGAAETTNASATPAVRPLMLLG